MHYHDGKSCSVRPFNDSYKPINNVQTVDAAFAIDTPDGKGSILHVNHALDFTTTMEHSILCTNQARINGTVINDVPTIVDHTSTQNVSFPEGGESFNILYNGPVPYLQVRYPTDDDLNTLPHLNLTSPHGWNPGCLTSPNKGVAALNIIDDCKWMSDIFNEHIFIGSIKHVQSQSLSPEYLSSLWQIPLNIAKRTLETTTQDSIRYKDATGNVLRRVSTKPHQSRYRQLGGFNAHFASDTFKANFISLRGNKYSQLFCNRANYVKVYPMKKKSDSHHTLHRFVHEVGIPVEMLTDGALELTKSEWGKICMKHNIHQHTTEPHTPWQNPAENMGGRIRRKVKSIMRKTNTPVRLWDYCWEYTAALTSLTASDNVRLDGVTPYEHIHGSTPNITEYIYFKWFQWVWYHDPVDPNTQLLGRWLGPAADTGQGLAHHILSFKSKVKTRSTVTALTEMELKTNEVKTRMSDYTKNIEALIGNYANATVSNSENIDVTNDKKDIYDQLFEDDNDDEHIENQELDEDSNPLRRPDIDEYPTNDPPFTIDDDENIGRRVQLPHHSGEMHEAIIKRRKIAADGSLVGTRHSNPLMDTREYSVEFPDGTTAEYHANVIAENLYSQIDDEGNQYTSLSGICDHKSDENAVKMKNGWFVRPSGARKRVITTKGWWLKVEWKDGTTTWAPLNEIKESNPIEAAEYAVAHGIDKQPAFAWWVGHVLNKRNQIISKVEHRVLKKNMKFGIIIPHDEDHALQLDKENGNDYWAKAIEKERKNVIIAFELLQDGEEVPIGSKHIPIHWIFDVKIDLTRKARLVAGGHRNKHVPKYMTYASVVSRESVRLCFLIAAINDLDILCADIGNAYLNAPCREKSHTTIDKILFGPEYEGKQALIVRALYGLKSSGASWRHTLSNTIQGDLGYTQCTADRDVYLKLKTKHDGSQYYSYIVAYVDDILSIDHDPNIVMKQIGDIYRLKDGIQFPSMYLGTNVKKWEFEDGGTSYAMGSSTYCKEAIRIAEARQRDLGLSCPTGRRNGRDTPFSTSTYRPELEDTQTCNAEQHTIFQNLIGILRWLIELGRIDILLEVSLLSQYLAQPRIGHLQQVFNIFRYLKSHTSNPWLVSDQADYDIEWSSKNGEPSPWELSKAMREIYYDAKDELPPNMPKPLGRPVNINAFVDADHAGNLATRRSHTGILIFVNMAPITWYSKRQNTVETSTFSSEMVALRIATEMIEGLRYKLRMLGVPLEGPARVYCDNESVVKNTTYPESSLKKKHCAVAYHKIRESVAAQKILIFHESTGTNLADLFTKTMNFEKRSKLIKCIIS